MYTFESLDGNSWMVKDGRLGLLDPDGNLRHGVRGLRPVRWITPPVAGWCAEYHFPGEQFVNRIPVVEVHKDV
jgi:hypothetical protein